MSSSSTFARRVYFGSAVYGILVLLPQYFLEERLGRDFPPPVNHPEHFYGFVGVALAWQIAFLVISRDVVRFRPLMPVAVAEKWIWAATTLALFLAGRVPGPVLAVGAIDLALGALFLVAYLRLAGSAPQRS